MADKRIPILLDTPAVRRFVSIEPMLGSVNINRLTFKHCPEHDFDGGFCMEDCGAWVTLNWIIIGGESGPKARHMDEDWVRSLRDQCQAASVPFFYKQKIVNGRKVKMPELDGRVWDQVPGDVA